MKPLRRGSTLKARRATGPAARLPWAACGLLLMVSFAGLALYTDGIDQYRRPYFDEQFYVTAAFHFANGTWGSPCEGPSEAQRPLNLEHPPLAKVYLTHRVKDLEKEVPAPPCGSPLSPRQAPTQAFVRAIGEKRVAETWRLPSAWLGAAALLLVGGTAWRLLRSHMAGILAAGLTLTDGVMFTASRAALLDIYAAAFLVAAAFAATWPRRSGRIAAGLLLGLAVSSKLTALLAAPAVALIALWCHHRVQPLDHRRVGLVAAWLAGLPPLVLAATYAPWWRIWISNRGLIWAVGNWLRVQWDMLRFSRRGPLGVHEDSVPAWAVLGFRKSLYLYDITNVGNQLGQYAFVYSFGNPVLWWAGTTLVALTLGLAARRLLLRRRAAKQTEGGPGTPPFTDREKDLLATCLLPLAAYAPFLLLAREVFTIYMATVVPFLAISSAGILVQLWRKGGRAGRAGAVAFGALVVLAFAHFYPVWSGQPVSESEARRILDTIPWMQQSQ